MNAYYIFIQNRQKVETILIPMQFNGWISKMCYIHTMEYYLIMKINEV